MVVDQQLVKTVFTEKYTKKINLIQIKYIYSGIRPKFIGSERIIIMLLTQCRMIIFFTVTIFVIKLGYIKHKKINW